MMELRARLEQGLPCVGAWSTAASPLLAEAMASCGFHWLATDLEHSPIDLETAAAIFAAAERHGAAPMARLPSADPYLARRLLDAGAVGLIVPVVESARDFAEFARHCVYPGQGGRRGVGLSRANLWGDRFSDYSQGFRPILAAQIETRAGVAAAAEIAASPQTDVLFLGPYDLSADLGTPGDFETPEMRAAMAQVRAACAAAGAAPGIHQVEADPQALRRRFADGFRFVAYATDVTAMRSALGRPLSLTESCK